MANGTWTVTLAGLCASLVGIGLARFAYTPLIPALIADGWFTPSQAAYLAAANLVGYLAGALLGAPLARVVRAPVLLRMMMVLATATFFACSTPVSFLWFFFWRFISGATGGVLMVLAAPVVLARVPAARRGLASGAIFTGVGLGIAMSGTVVPVLLRGGLGATWLGLACLATALTALPWNSWPDIKAGSGAPVSESGRRGARHNGPLLIALYLEYGLNAVGVVPHMVFLVDFIARGLGQGLDVGAGYWVLFGALAMVGPMFSGYLGDRIGFRRTLLLSLVLQGASLALVAVNANLVTITVSTVVVGAMVPGIVAVALGRVHELLPGDVGAQQAAWSLCTVAWAVGQAIGAYAMSYLFAATGGYHVLFLLAAVALGLAIVIDLALALFGRPRAPQPDRIPESDI